MNILSAQQSISEESASPMDLSHRIAFNGVGQSTPVKIANVEIERRLSSIICRFLPRQAKCVNAL